MKYTNRSSVGEGSVQSSRVHRLVKAFVDQVWSDKKNVKFTDEVKARHRHIDVSLINQILIEADWLVI